MWRCCRVFAVVSSAVGASIGVTALWATGATDLAAPRLWMAWSVSDVLGMLIGAPAVVALVSAGTHPEQRRRLEKVVAVAVVVGAAYVTFATNVFLGVERLSDRLFHVAAGDVDCDSPRPAVHGNRDARRDRDRGRRHECRTRGLRPGPGGPACLAAAGLPGAALIELDGAGGRRCRARPRDCSVHGS